MSNPKFTKGEWKLTFGGTLTALHPIIFVADKNWDGEIRELAELENIMLSENADGVWENVPNRAEIEANANLLLAAPDLYAVLSQIITDWLRVDSDEGGKVLREHTNQALSALAKARGE